MKQRFLTRPSFLSTK